MNKVTMAKCTACQMVQSAMETRLPTEGLSVGSGREEPKATAGFGSGLCEGWSCCPLR